MDFSTVTSGLQLAEYSALLLSGCSTQKEIQKNHSTGLYFNELNNLCLVAKVKLYDTKDEAIDVYVNNKKVVSELHDEEMALVVSNRDYITTRKSTTHNRYMNYSDYLCHHTNDDLEAGRMIIYDFEKNDNQKIKGTVLLALFDSGENFIDAKTYFLSNKKKQRFEWVYTEPYCYAEVTVLAYKDN